MKSTHLFIHTVKNNKMRAPKDNSYFTAVYNEEKIKGIVKSATYGNEKHYDLYYTPKDPLDYADDCFGYEGFTNSIIVRVGSLYRKTFKVGLESEGVSNFKIVTDIRAI